MNIFIRYLSAALACLISLVAYGRTPLDDILAQSKIPVTPQFITEEAFVRKTYLNTVGRIPSVEEYDSFIRNRALNKRSQLIQGLLKTEGFVSHWSNFWQELLRGKARLNEINFFNGEPYVEYVEKEIRTNVPYDKFVTKLLTSSGRYSESPVTGYFYRDKGMPLDNFIGTMRIFAGTDISCAQCHDDPFQPWTQRAFYQGLSYFSQIDLVSESKEAKQKIKRIADEIKVKNGEVANGNARLFLVASQSSLEILPKKETSLPTDYQYSDAKGGSKVQAKPLFGETPENFSTDKRESFIEWLLEREEFDTNIANRIFGYIFGEPIVPLNPRTETTVERTAVAEKLGQRLRALKYDLRVFVTELYNSDFFQREPYRGDIYKYSLQAPIYRRLSAEQIWDSIVVLSVGNPDYFKTSFSEEYRKILSINIDTVSADEVMGKLEAYNKAKKDEFKDAKKFGQFLLVRASSVLDFNTATGQLLKKFGRSDRELIGASSREGSGTQVMAFMNGPMTNIVSDPESEFSKRIALLKSNQKEAVDKIFISIVSRKPHLIERQQFENTSISDLAWALLNSIEFKFN